LKRAARKLAQFGVVRVRVREEKAIIGCAEDCNIFRRNGNAYHHLRTGCLLHKGIISAVKTAEHTVITGSLI
jgi:hypothetical protein